MVYAGGIDFRTEFIFFLLKIKTGFMENARLLWYDKKLEIMKRL